MSDFARGAIALDGLVVTGSQTEEALLASGIDTEPFVHNGSYRSYKLPPAEIEGRAFIPVLWFEDGRIARLTLAYDDPAISGWDDWTEAAMRAAHRGNRRWLDRRLGRWGRRRFDWGEVRAVADPRSGSASIVFDFAA